MSTNIWSFAISQQLQFFSEFFKKNEFIYLFNLFLAELGLCCCTRAFSSCGEQGLLFLAVRGLLVVVGFSCCGAWSLGVRASVVEAHRL